jgi:macrolide-specific efflux system membrane fusion protein
MPARTHRRPSALALALAAAAAVVVVVGVTSVGSTPARTVRQQLVTAKRGVVQSTVSGSGTLSPAKQSDVNFGTSGTINAIHVKVGRHVSSGEVLANLDTSAAEVQLASAKADLQNADDELTSAETAAATPATTTPSSSSSAGGSTMSVAAAQAAVASAQLTLRNAETALANTALHAPISGTVASISGAVGDSVGGSSSSNAANSSSAANGANASSSASSSSSSSSAFIVLAQVHHFKMDVSLTESDIGSVKVGQPATVTVNAADGQEFSAHVSAIGVLASSSSSSTSSAVSYPVTLTLDQRGSKLKPGMSASADIITGQQSGISVPTQALQGSTVTVARNGKSVSVPVQTGLAGDSNTIITSGVTAGEQVVVTSTSAAAGAAATGAATGTGNLRRLGAGAGIGSALGGGGGAGFRGGFGGGPPPGAGGG